MHVWPLTFEITDDLDKPEPPCIGSRLYERWSFALKHFPNNQIYDRIDMNEVDALQVFYF